MDKLHFKSATFSILFGVSFLFTVGWWVYASLSLLLVSTDALLKSGATRSSGRVASGYSTDSKDSGEGSDKTNKSDGPSAAAAAVIELTQPVRIRLDNSKRTIPVLDTVSYYPLPVIISVWVDDKGWPSELRGWFKASAKAQKIEKK